MDVKAGKSKKVKIEYDLFQSIPLGSQPFSYNLQIFKQPGIDSYPYSFSISYPKSLKIINGLSSSSLDIATDKELKIDFAQKN